MKNLTKLILTLMILAAPVAFGAAHDHADKAAAQARPYTAKTPKLDRAQFDALLAKPEQLLIIDVRRPDEVSAIGGFPVYLSIQSKELENNLAFIPKDKTIITVSNHAGRAGKAADLLVAKGFNVAGAVGAQNYEEEGGKLTKVAVPGPKSSADQKQ
ncbi:MAG: rhodanese-like domain-containing protein [Methylovulum sp.]|nr:MAG: rhodanese-like domain-containing protein [Methylovulum sp.]